MKILLINPGTPDEIDNRIIREIPYLFARAFIAPHAVATVAALTPPEHEVDIHDEYMRGPVDLVLPCSTYDIIGISITCNQLERSLKIAGLCKKHCTSSTVVAGGIGVEALIYKNKDDFDVIIHGEAEETWPQFLEDYKKGSWLHIYKNFAKPDMTRVPAPRWELIAKDIKSYNSVSIQTTRGCPYDCSFCDVIYTYGRKPRSKTAEQVLGEVKKLSELKVEMVFIADDNFASDKKYVKDLLRKLIKLNNSFSIPLKFFTQLDITIAADDELLCLLADANFYTVMIGVESVNDDSLKDLNKKQNMGISLSEAIRKIQSYGIIVLTHMIIGADSDDKGIFKRTADFINEANIVFHICHPLSAPPGTKMWYKYKRQGRITSYANAENSDKFDIITNIIPKQMTRIELFEGLAKYWDEVYNIDAFIERTKDLIANLKYKPNVKKPGLKSLWDLRKMLLRVFTFFMFEVENKHRRAFFSLIKFSKTKLAYLMPKIIYIYTFYLIDVKRSTYDSKIAREHAQWERENADKIIIEPDTIPVSENIRNNASQLVGSAYHQVRARTSQKEVLYHTVVSAMVDYNDRFGETIDAFDEYYNEQMILSCERIMDQLAMHGNETGHGLPFTPPAGFTREILDALDNAVRYRNM